MAVRLACDGSVEVVELDTSHFVGNAPGWAALSYDGGELLARTALQPDTRHRFAVPGGPVAGQVRLDIYPDGAWPGCGCSAGPRPRHGRRWPNGSSGLLPGPQLAALLRAAGLPPDEAARRAEARAGPGRTCRRPRRELFRLLG